jgi:hypothetical protein
MANPYQQQVFQRKLIYIGMILVLFTGAWLWRTTLVNAQANALKIREEDRGEVELSGAAARVGALCSQGVLTCILWHNALELQKKNQWNELRLQVEWLTRLQPHFITPWLFQSWNLAYNVSVESDRPADKYYYISEGINLLARGERQNANQPDLRWSTGFYTMHKICISDDTNYQRSLFQLSLIPPHERDPARFWKQNSRGEAEFNWAEFQKFCADHPQLVRRLRIGMHKDSAREKKRLFICEKPEDVVQFLQDNYQVPGLYRVSALPVGVPASSRGWSEKPERPDVHLGQLEGFPVLPPERKGAFDPTALYWAVSALGDDVDAYGVAQSWFAYALEPIPPADKLPGSTQPITDPVRQRKPRNMTTLIFRSYPAQGRRFMAERLQQEGWFDDEGWDITDWFEDSKEYAGKQVKVGGGVKWSLDAWVKAKTAWNRQGEDNHLLPSPTEEANLERLAERFRDEHPGYTVRGPVPPIDVNKLDTAEKKEEYDAAKYLAELAFYQHVSNFLHHYQVALVESQEETVTTRKLFFRAEDQLYLKGNKLAALRTYQKREALPAWKGRTLNPLEAWLELVLLKNEKFRRDENVQEQTAEIQFRYMDLYNTLEGRPVREEVARASGAVPASPATLMMMLPLLPEIRGPFDVEVRDAQGRDLGANIDPRIRYRVMERLNMVPKFKTPPQFQPSSPAK